MDEAALHELLSGRRAGPGASLLRGGLTLASSAYSAVMTLRNTAYDQGWLKTHRVSVPVISLGNITTGGTGKTPTAAWLANWLRACGRRPGLLSRGYRALSPTDQSNTGEQPQCGNDEKLVLDRLCPEVPHLQQKDRVGSARRAVQEFGCDVLLLDDGFQHRRLDRDLDLVLIDALQPWGYGYPLPRGLLRERQTGLSRADLILITRANQCSKHDLATLRSELQRLCPGTACIDLAFKPTQAVDLHWQAHPLSTLKDKNCIAFCGIGNPKGFEQTVSSIETNCKQFRHFADHHHYSRNDHLELEQLAATVGADVVLTTQKDLVKIAADQWKGPPLLAIEIGLEFLAGQDLLETRLRQILPST
ncbi:tetraacyldisaccharide 4'-kinase [Schlesneria sp. T3-172]|uniref:tetraacyldisaccharide 4'-kinase n=1 Tax=Schlesneria sphaerica TaxID=3373610 RepID=UPI0037C79A7F